VALKLYNLRSIASVGRGPLWQYETEDDVTAAGYFNGASAPLEVGDRIYVTVLSGTTYSDSAKYVVTGNSAGVVTVEEVSSIPEFVEPSFTALTEVALGSNTTAAYANSARYIITGTGGGRDYPTDIAATGGHDRFGSGTLQMHGADTGPYTNDCLYFFRFPLSVAITTAPDHAEIKINVASFTGIDAYPSAFKIRGITTDVAWPADGAETAAPIGHGAYTTAVAWLFPAWSASGEITIDVTDIVAELAGTSAASGDIIFLFETVNFDIDSGITLASYATLIPKLYYSTATSRIGYLKRAITGGNVLFYHPNHGSDLPAEAGAMSTFRRTSYRQSESWPTATVGAMTSYKDTAYAAEMTLAGELGPGVYSRRAVGKFVESQLEYYALTTFGVYDYLTIFQCVQSSAGGNSQWLWDVNGDFSFAQDLQELSSGPYVRVKFVSNQNTSIGEYYDSVGAVKTLVAYRVASTGQWHFGYHNGQVWQWTVGPIQTNNLGANAPISGLTLTPSSKVQGLLCVELTTPRSLGEIKNIAKQARAMWSANQKYLPTLL
jgi:hypothetical protein